MMDEIDLRAIVRLLGEVSMLKAGSAEKKRFLLGKLCVLVGADGWSWSLSQRGLVRRLDGMWGRPLADATPDFNERPLLEPPAAIKARALQLELTVRQISEEGVSSIRLSRKPGQPPFSPRERQIGQIVLSEISWLHRNPPAHEKAGATLSPRQRATLLHLADGLPRRAIAQQLRLSQHTVDGYVKAIYQHYRVNSRATLMKRFARIGGEELVP